MDLTGPAPGQEPRRPSVPPPRRKRRDGRTPPPHWLMTVLSLCLAFLVITMVTRPFRPEEEPGAVAAAAGDGTEPAGPVSPIQAAASEEAAAVPSQEPVFTPEPVASAGVTPESTLPPETKEALPAGEEEALRELVTPAESGSWFSDAVFIGDSRVAGLRLYSGITPEAAFLDHTGLTVYEVRDGKKVIRRGEEKISVLDALSERTYGKVYIALGVNELGYFDPTGFAQACGEVTEAVREKQPEARIYVQSLLPVNTAKCKANEVPYYVTNEGIAGYNAALASYFADKDVYLLGIPEGLTDENGEVFKDCSADGVHFKKDGYVLWLNYLAAHPED